MAVWQTCGCDSMLEFSGFWSPLMYLEYDGINHPTRGEDTTWIFPTTVMKEFSGFHGHVFNVTVLPVSGYF